MSATDERAALPAKDDLHTIAGSFLAFAAMLQEDFGVSKAFALRALALAYDVNSEESHGG